MRRSPELQGSCSSGTLAIAMTLYIGKNHQGNTTPVQSIFRLAGSDEDALTFALGFLMADDYNFCADLVRHLRVAPRRALNPGYSIHLQEVTDSAFGRRDIVIEDRGMRIVLEAKVGGVEPTAEQLLKYIAEKDLWDQYEACGLVALTQVQLSPAVQERVRTTLSERKIRFNNVQWHQIVDLVLRHRPTEGSDVSRYLFEEFIRYIRRDYRMGYYDAEILIQDVNPLNADIFSEGWMYVTSLKDKKAPLYFAPYFTAQGANSGISMISRVKDTELAVLATKQEVVKDPPSEEHLQKWRHGLAKLRKRAHREDFEDQEVRLFYLDRPIKIATTPLRKSSFNAAGPSKKIPSQIPKGFSMGFDDLLPYGLAIT